MSTPFVVDSALALDGAQRGIQTARSYQLPISEHFLHSEACFAEATRLVNEPAPQFDGLPEDPAKLAAVIRKAATARGVHDAAVDMAKTAANYAAASMVVAYQNALPGYVDTIAERFAEIAADFIDARGKSSDTLSPYADEDAVHSYMALQRAASKLDGLAHARLTFAATIGEPEVHRDLPWHVVAPPAPDETDRVQVMRDLLEEMTTRAWQERDAVSRWTALNAAATLSVAPLRTVHARVTAWQRAESSSGGVPIMTPHGADDAKIRRERDIAARLAAGNAARVVAL